MTEAPDRPVRLTVLSSGRADYSILSPLLALLERHPRFDLRIAAFGMHLWPGQGDGVAAIRADGYSVEVIEVTFGGDRPEGIGRTMGATTQAFADHFAAGGTDAVICVGDRYEMFAAVAATVPFALPVVHLHGGEETAGAMDDAFRHAISAMASLHLTAHPAYAERVRRIVGSGGADRVHAVGALGLDAIAAEARYDVAGFREAFGVDLGKPTLLVTFHPETRRGAHLLDDVDAFVAALNRVDGQILVTLPNADTYGSGVRDRLIAGLGQRDDAFTFEMLGRKGYYSALALCEIVVGNSSSGIIEAASFAKPVVNVGDRQKGRLRGPNVIDCPVETEAIVEAIGRARSMGPIAADNIYGDGCAAPRILRVLETEFLERRLA